MDGRRPVDGNLLDDVKRRDVSVLHIDTHGGEGGHSIQVSRNGKILAADALPGNIRLPLVLLFGCEGLANSASFGSVLVQRGAGAVISSYAKFTSFGITGDTEQEDKVYSAFFDALLAGENLGAALLQFRRAALDATSTSLAHRILTRLFFILVGNDHISFKFASQ